jgi:hypothetical protein
MPVLVKRSAGSYTLKVALGGDPLLMFESGLDFGELNGQPRDRRLDRNFSNAQTALLMMMMTMEFCHAI